jgi:hypothetical protein
MAHDLSGPSPEREEVPAAARRRGINFSPWNLLLLLPLVGTLVPGWYNRKDPTLFDIPFFYWYQMAAILISVLVTFVVYRATRGQR